VCIGRRDSSGRMMENVGVGIGVLNCVGGSILSGDGATERMD
jgi:hypothetical protein